MASKHAYLQTMIKMSYKYFIWFTAIAALILQSCSEDKEFTIGESFIETKTRIQVLDTFTVELSTVIMDSLYTSGTGILFAGNYEDSTFGKVTCNSYFQIGLPSIGDMSINDVYDSIVLIMQYSGYSYGDTTQPVRISAHLLDENLETDEDGNLYNCSLIDYDEEIIGTTHFIPHPDSLDSIRIRLDDAIGTDLFEKCMNNDETVTLESSFLNYIKGIAIIADENEGNSIIGFKAGEGEIVLRLYTHRIAETYEEIPYDFVLYEEEKQFNQIIHDFSMCPLENLRNRKEDLPFTETGNRTYVQGGTGLMTKIQFPYLEELMFFERGIIMNVQLILVPDKESYFDFDLPEYLVFYETNKNNNFGNVLSDDYGYALTPVFTLDEMFHEETSYSFNITSFIKNEFADDYFDIEHGLLLSLPTDELLSTFERLVLDPEETKLRLYYLTY